MLQLIECVRRYWSLYLGRPTMMKTQDIAPSCLSKDFGRLISCRPSGHEKTHETRVYEALLQLMELVGPLCDLEVKRSTKLTDAYFKIAALDRELNSWYTELPEDLKWTAENIANGPAPLLLLQYVVCLLCFSKSTNAYSSQYHTALILLHRPFVKYGQSQAEHASKETDTERVNHFTMLSRTVCGDNAKRVAMIFKRYRERFDLTQVFVTGLQHVGTAATALMAEILIQSNHIERKELLCQLGCLKQTLSLMSRTYQPAVLMCSVVEHFIKDCQRVKETNAQAPETPMGANISSNVSFDHLVPFTGTATYGRKRPYNYVDNAGEGFGTTTKRARFDGTHCFTPRGARGQSPKGLPFLPSSWLEEFDFEDTEFLNLMGLKDLQNNGSLGLLSSSTFPGDTDFGLN
jgi:hypothetical protein